MSVTAAYVIVHDRIRPFTGFVMIDLGYPHPSTHTHTLDAIGGEYMYGVLLIEIFCCILISTCVDWIWWSKHSFCGDHFTANVFWWSKNANREDIVLFLVFKFIMAKTILDISLPWLLLISSKYKYPMFFSNKHRFSTHHLFFHHLTQFNANHYAIYS